MGKGNIKEHRWVAPNNYLQYLHDHALITLFLYSAIFPDNKRIDYEAFWSKQGFVWLN